jgi:hypothetical protein
MAFTPDSPFPKTRGHVIKSKDWNDAITEVQRLDTSKVNKTGDSISGPLTISGNVGIGLTGPQRALSVNAALNVDQANANNGAVNPGITFGSASGEGMASKRTAGGNQFGLDLYTGSAVRLSITNSGNVGIGTSSPGAKLEVNGDVALMGKHALRGNDTWLRLNQDGVFTAGVHTPGLFAPLSLNVGGAGGWSNPGAGNVWITGSVGIGVTDPSGFALDVADRIRLRQGSGSAGLWLFQSAPAKNQAFIGMRSDTEVGLFGATGGGWGLFMDTNRGHVTMATDMTVNRNAQLGASGGQVFIGGNLTGPFMRLNDDLWFSDQQNGTIWIRNGNDSNWGTLVGIFNNQSSIKYKKDTSVLRENDLTYLLDDTLGTDVVRYRYKGDDEATRLRLGVITENCPQYLVGDDGESLSTTEYIAMLHGALKALANRMAVLEKSSTA